MHRQVGGLIRSMWVRACTPPSPGLHPLSTNDTWRTHPPAKQQRQWDTLQEMERNPSILPPGVTLRPAQPADLPGVVSLCRHAYGEDYHTDYIPGYYLRLLDDPNRSVYVALHGQTVVTFGMTYLVDGGMYMQGEAGRTHPDYQGHGLFWRVMFQSLVSLVPPNSARRQIYQCIRGSSTQTNTYDTHHADKIHKYETRVALRIKLPIAVIKSGKYEHIQRSSSIYSLNCEEVEGVLNSDAARQPILPSGYLVCNHNVYTALACNIRPISRYHPHMFGSFPGDGSLEAITALSIGGGVSCDDGKAFRYDFNYYGPPQVECMLSHLRQHICLLKTEQSTENVYLIVMLPRSFKNMVDQETIQEGILHLFDAGSEQMGVTVLTQYAFKYIRMLANEIHTSRL